MVDSDSSDWPFQADVELTHFLGALYRETDLVELRPIETWTDSNGRKRSQVLRNFRRWLTPRDLFEIRDEIKRWNLDHKANIFVGVNPRPFRGASSKRTIHVCRSVWADLDDVTMDEAHRRWTAISIPPPTIVVNSGSGIHAYWVLDKPYDLDRSQNRAEFESMLRSFYDDLGADAIHDVSRLLRLPGFLNVKNFSSGRSPTICRLLECVPNRVYNLNCFSRWRMTGGSFHSTTHHVMMPSEEFPPAELFVGGQCQDIIDDIMAQFTNRLDRAVKDRSRRDYAVICGLLRLGLSQSQIWSLVAEKSKFRTNGRSYFDITFENATQDVFS